MTTLLALVEALARDPEAKADYAAGPDAFLQRHGFGDLSPADVNEAVLHASNTLPAPAAAQVEPGGGLDSVAAVDPTSFEPEPGADYEEDLFGHDPGDGFDDGVAGFGGDDGAADEADELAATPGPADHDGTEPDQPDHPAQADHPELSDSPGDDHPGAGDELAAGAPTGAAGPSLASLHDPHDLDGDLPSPGAPATMEAAAEQAPAADHALAEPATEVAHDADTTPAGFFDHDGSGDLGGFDPTLGADDPFAASEPLGSDPWYDDSAPTSFDVEVDEPDEDLLDDVDDMDLTD